MDNNTEQILQEIEQQLTVDELKAIVRDKMSDFMPYTAPDASQDYLKGGWEVLSSLAEPLGLSVEFNIHPFTEKNKPVPPKTTIIHSGEDGLVIAHRPHFPGTSIKRSPEFQNGYAQAIIDIAALGGINIQNVVQADTTANFLQFISRIFNSDHQ